MASPVNQLQKLKNYQSQSGESPNFHADQLSKSDSFDQQFEEIDASNPNLQFASVTSGENNSSNPSPDLFNYKMGPNGKLYQNNNHFEIGERFQNQPSFNKFKGRQQNINISDEKTNQMEEIMDLSQLHQLTDQNQQHSMDERMTNNRGNMLLERGNIGSMMRNLEQDEVDIDQIQLNLAESDEIDQMDRMMRQKMNFAQKQLYQHMDLQNKKNILNKFNDPHEQLQERSNQNDELRGLQGDDQTHGGEFSLQDVVVDTPPSNYNFNESDIDSQRMENMEADFEMQKKMQLDQQKFMQENQHQQIQNELRELLAQSSSEQLFMIHDENDKIGTSPRAKGAVNAKQGGFEVEDSPLDQLDVRKAFERPNKDVTLIDMSSPPLVASKSTHSKELIKQPSEDSTAHFVSSNGPSQKSGADLKPDFTDFKNNQGRKSLSPKNNRFEEADIMSLAQSGGNQIPDLTPGVPSIQPQEEQKSQKKPEIPKKQPEADDLKPKEKKNAKDPTSPPLDAAEGEENDSFHRLYNKEIKVNQDEIPLLLLELTDIAYKFIKKDQYEKAYVLLQKTESVLEVVNLDHSKRDKYFAYITYSNMAMCFQKLGMLEECIIYLKETIQVIEKYNFFKDISISQRIKQLHMQCQLKLQLCAILSQTQKHSEAMEHAKISVRVSHQILRDMYDLCVFYSNKIKFKDDFGTLSILLDELLDADSLNGKSPNDSKDKDAPKTIGNGKHTQSEIQGLKMQKEFIRCNSPVRDIPYNIMEESISMIERTALKLLPILKELGNRLAGSNGSKGLQAFHNIPAVVNEKETKLTDKNIQENTDKKKLEAEIKKKTEKKELGLVISDDDDIGDLDIKDVDVDIKNQANEQAVHKTASTAGDKDKKQEEQIDMRTVLGFLNQNEWIQNLNIGNIMQIQPIRMKDFMNYYRNEQLLSRESFLEKLQLLIVSYFCVSTEMRFIVQARSGFMKPDVKLEKELEQEYWHVKALDIACAFLPSECPLFNHILLSYQKHHDPSSHPIEEDAELDDDLKVLRPLKGIENFKHQPIIRELNNVYIDIQEIPMSPLSKCFDKRLLPKKIKTQSMNIQTDPIEEPPLPLMKSQSISVQDDLKIVITEPNEPKPTTIANESTGKKFDKKYNEDSSSEIFDANNVYADLSQSKYQEKLISKIIDDPKIDKQQFLSKLMSRVSSQDPNNFTGGNMLTYENAYTNVNSMNFHSNSNIGNMDTIQKNFPKNQFQSNDTLIGDQKGNDDSIYGAQKNPRSKMANKVIKSSQSGNLNFKSFDQKFQSQTHVQSMYGESSNDVTVIGGQAKHHIVSQNLAPSYSVITEKKGGLFTKKGSQQMAKNMKNVISHKKNQSISGGNSNEIFPVNNKKQTLNQSSYALSKTDVNRSVNSNLSSNYNAKKQKQFMELKQGKQIRRMNQGQKLTHQIEKQYTNINLSNQKLAVQKRSQKLQSTSDFGGNQRLSSNELKESRRLSNQINRSSSSRRRKTKLQHEYRNIMSKSKQVKKQKAKNQTQHQKLLENTLIESLKDIMSDSSQGDADPDLHPQPHSESQTSDVGIIQQQKSSPEHFAQVQAQQNTSHQNGQDIGGKHQNQKMRPQSAITNYTSQSGNKAKLSKQRAKGENQQQNQNNQKGFIKKQLAIVQQQQNFITNLNKIKQSQSKILGQNVPKKKQKVVSRKKYGSDRSSNSPPPDHAYSIQQSQPFSIFDNNNAHSISHSTNQPQQHGQHSIQNFQNLINQQSEASIINNANAQQFIKNQKALQHMYYDQKGHLSQLSQQSNLNLNSSNAHSNSQTLAVDKNKLKKKANAHALLNKEIQNQSENILAKLQSLLVNNKEDDRSHERAKDRMEKRGKQLNNQANDSNKRSQQNNQFDDQEKQAFVPQSSNQRKSANSIGSLGQSQTRQSRYSQNLNSRSKSRVSRSRSSKKSSKSRQPSQNKLKTVSNERSNPRQQMQEPVAVGSVNIANRSQMKHPKIKTQDKVPNFLEVNNSLIPSAKNQTIGGTNNIPNQAQKDYKSSLEIKKLIEEGHDLEAILDLAEFKHLQNQNISQLLHEKKRKGRSSALRNSRPKSSIFQDRRNSLPAQKSQKKKVVKKGPAKGHNGSLETLQRQVLENQMILINNLHAQQPQKQKRPLVGKHSHNNSIGQMNNISDKNQLVNERNQAHLKMSQLQTQKSANLNKSVLTSSATSGTKKKSKRQMNNNTAMATQNPGPQSRMQNQTVNKSYNTSQLLNHLQGNLNNIQRNDLQFKMTQQNLSGNLRNFGNMNTGPQGGVLSTSSTSGNFVSGKSMKNRKVNNKRRGSIKDYVGIQNQSAKPPKLQQQPQQNFLNFEQLQKQMQNGLTLGGQDLMHQTDNSSIINNDYDSNMLASAQQNSKLMQIQMNLMNDAIVNGSEVQFEETENSGSIGNIMGFVPHRNLMPKTTGSHAHLLNINDEPNNSFQKQYNSLNQTGKTVQSLNKYNQKRPKNSNFNN